MPTTFRCLNEGCPLDEFTLSSDFGSVTVANHHLGGANFLVTCPRCGSASEQAPVNGVYSGVGGRFHLVQALADRLESTPPTTNEALAQELEQAAPFLAPLARWVREHQDLVISSVIAVVLFVLGHILDEEPAQITPEQLERIIDDAEDQPREVRDGRDAPRDDEDLQ